MNSYIARVEKGVETRQAYPDLSTQILQQISQHKWDILVIFVLGIIAG
ncbi:MAG: hypothetical protein HRU34_21920 [Richelia sp.]|nr:hypothetical protein [Richelia sp.]CDN13043.1 hypothetical protein RintRC_1062 [Richelia intracellularis]